ncbi:MAG: transposase, partial [Lachnospiraceae bacterium]
MAANYEKNIYNQLLDVMSRLDKVEHDLSDEKIEHKEDVDRLNKKISNLEQENKLLINDNERLKSIINNDSSNT